MADENPSAIDRIDRALARIEAAAVAHTRAEEAIKRRHAVLRSRVAEAIEALDTVITQGARD